MAREKRFEDLVRVREEALREAKLRGIQEAKTRDLELQATKTLYFRFYKIASDFAEGVGWKAEGYFEEGVCFPHNSPGFTIYIRPKEEPEVFSYASKFFIYVNYLGPRVTNDIYIEHVQTIDYAKFGEDYPYNLIDAVDITKRSADEDFLKILEKFFKAHYGVRETENKQSKKHAGCIISVIILLVALMSCYLLWAHYVVL